MLISSGGVYAPSAEPVSEQSAVRASSPYVVSKLAMELQADYYRIRGLDVVVARPFNHIGPGQRLGFIVPDLVKKLSELKPGEALSAGNLATFRDYTDVRDVADAYVRLATGNAPRPVYNVASGMPRSGFEILETIAQCMAIEVPTLLDDANAHRPTDNPFVQGDATALREDTGWEPAIPFGDSIRDCVAHVVTRILTVCTGNICRSPAAELLLTKVFGPDAVVSSAGTHAMVGHGIPAPMLRCLERDGVDGRGHAARQFTAELASEADLIICMTARHRTWCVGEAPFALERTFLLEEIAAAASARSAARRRNCRGSQGRGRRACRNSPSAPSPTCPTLTEGRKKSTTLPTRSSIPPWTRSRPGCSSTSRQTPGRTPARRRRRRGRRSSADCCVSTPRTPRQYRCSWG